MVFDDFEWKAKWISRACINETVPKDSPLFRKEFILPDKELKNATAYAFGLGWYELYLNGFKVGDRVLSPANFNSHFLL